MDMKRIARFASIAAFFLLLGGTSPKIVSARPAGMAAAGTMASANNPASAHDRHRHRNGSARRHHHHRRR